ncbi:MAG: hypothetical protein WB995_06160, partial [Candidatus Acidiferrales bacterium]
LGPPHRPQVGFRDLRQMFMDGHQVVGFAAGLREFPLQELIEGLQIIEAPVLPGTDFAQITARIDRARESPGVFFLL